MLKTHTMNKNKSIHPGKRYQQETLRACQKLTIYEQIALKNVAVSTIKWRNTWPKPLHESKKVILSAGDSTFMG